MVKIPQECGKFTAKIYGLERPKTGDWKVMAFKLKMNEQGHAVVVDGKPIYVDDEGKELPFCANEAWNKYHTLNEENKKRRMQAEELSAKLKAFEGFDPEVIKRNAEIAEKFKEHEAIKNGEIEKLKNELVSTSEKKIKEWEQKYNQLNETARQREERLNNEINNSILDSMFSGSEYVKKNVEMPVRGLRALFANRFKVDPETRKVYAVDEEGNTLLSENKIGAVASFEEALELLIKRDPDRDRILKATGTAGGGMRQNGKGITNADEAYLNDPKVSPVDKQKFLRKRQLA